MLEAIRQRRSVRHYKPDPVPSEVLKEIAEAARIEDRNHFEALVPRIYELGGKLPDDTWYLRPQFAIDDRDPHDQYAFLYSDPIVATINALTLPR